MTIKNGDNYLDSKYILNPNETLNGLGYGDYAQRHLEHVCSANPDSFNRDGGVLFVRTGILGSYTDTDKSVFGSTRDINDPKVILDRTSPFSHVVSNKDTICLSPLFSFFSKGQLYGGQTLDSTEKVYEAGRRDMKSSPAIFLNITTPEGKNKTIKDLREYWIETRPFTLSIPEDSRLVNFFEPTLISGTEYKDTVIVGFFVILKNLDKGYWRFDLGGIGAYDYITRGKIDVLVKEDPIVFPEDISAPKDLGKLKDYFNT